MDALTQADLDDLGCSAPHCTHDHSVLYIHCANCGKDESLAIRYEKLTGEVVAECDVCGKEVIRIAVKENEDV